MAGHSKWANIKHRKGAQDKKRGKSTIVDLLGYNKTLEFTFKLKKMIIKRLTKYKRKDDKLIRTINFIIDRSF